MYRSFVRGILWALALVAMPMAAQTWDAARDFQAANPAGQWSYGWKATPTAAFSPFPTYEASVSGFPSRDAWQDLGISSTLAVYHNTVGVSGDIPTNMLLLKPDTGKVSVVEWTAPAAMSVVVSGTFQSLDTVASSVNVVSSVSGVRFSGSVNSVAQVSAYGLFLNVAAGEKIDFVASGGGAGVNAVVRQLNIVGNATIQNLSATDTRLRVTNNSNGQVGGAWAKNRVKIDDGFDTTFFFNISQITGGGADGFAFVLQNASATALGGGGGGIGYDGVPASMAIEFDTFQGNDDPNDNHISVHTNGINPNSMMESASIGRVTPAVNLSDGNWHLVRVRYLVQPTKQLSIFLDNLTTPVLQITVDIPGTLQLTDGTLWAGFTGATGGYAEIHDVQNWYFQSLDVHPPVLTLPANITLEANTLGGASVSFSASSLDAVDGARPVHCTPASGSLFLVAATTVSCSSSDLSGNTANGSFTVTVTDTTPPALTVPVGVTAAAVDHNGAPVSFIATATDIVDGAITPVCLPASGSVFPLGTTSVSCSATDAHGNKASATFPVTVHDVTPPVVSAMSNVTVEATGSLTAVTWPGGSAMDNVDGTLPLNCSPASGSQFALGTTTVTCSATDAAGNTASVTFTVTVRDTTPPVISGMPSNLTVEATSASGAVANWAAPTANDLVDGSVAVTCAPASGSQFPLGTTTVSCSATDAHGNSASAGFSVKVQDTTPPALSGMPSNLTLEATSASGAIANWAAPTANDLVDGAVAVTCAPASGSQFPLGTTTVSCSATDAHGNAASASFSVKVQDTTPPTLSGVPSNLTLEATSASGAVASWAAPTATDLVDGSVAVTCAPASGSQFPLGTTTVSCSATDAHGNKASGSFSVKVQDTTAPVISGMPSNITLEATSASGAVASWAAPTANDVVDGSVAVICAPASGSQFALGTTTVSCSATDAHGNKASASFSVKVQDTAAPTISGMPSNLTLEATGSTGAAATWPSPTAVDAVDGALAVTCAPASGSMFPLGTTAVSCSASDSHGNKAAASFSVKVQDTTLPVISCGRPDGLWHASDVVIACTARDAGSGLANAADASFSLTTSVPSATETSNASTNSHTVCDVAGNCVTAGPIAGNMVDKRPPSISIAAPIAGTYALNQSVTASYSCTDGGSGVATCAGPVASGSALDTASVGAKTFVVNAQDKVGNASSSSVQYNVNYTVVYNVCVISGTEVRQADRSLPIRLNLCDAHGNNVSTDRVQVTAVSLVGPNGANLPVIDAGNSSPGGVFRFVGAGGGGGYAFNLQTKGLAAGYYEVVLSVSGDPMPHHIGFEVNQ